MENTNQTQTENEARFAVLEAKVEALVAEISALQSAPAATGNALAKEKTAKTALAGTTFKIGKKTFRATYPSILLDGEDVTEAKIAADKKLQEKLLADHPNLLTEVED